MAADTMDRVIANFGQEPRFMQEQSGRTAARHARIAQAAPDVQAWKGKIPLEMVERLQRLDEKGQ